MTEVAIDPNTAESVGVACGSCKRRYRIKQAPRKASPEMERYRKARAFFEHRVGGIDPAAAYSVLEGIMTLADARGASATPAASSPAVPSQTASRPAPPATPAPSSPSAPGTPAPETSAPETSAPGTRAPVTPEQGTRAQIRVTAPYLPSGGPEPSIPAAPAVTTMKMPAQPAGGRRMEEGPEYDDGFKAAVRDGCLTPQQAAERGDREALIHRLAQRHRLPSQLAVQVAENRITVHQALQRKAATEAQEVPRPQTSISHGVWNFTIATLGCLILLGAGARAWQEWEEYLTTKADAAQRPALVLPSAPVAPAEAPQGGSHAAPSTPSLTLPVTDAAGQLIMVTGPDPRSVLVAFCNTGHNAGRRQAFAIGPSSPPSGTARVGLFRNLEQPNAPMRAIRIRRDTRSGRWMAGDGHQPIQTEPSPDLSTGARLIPVTAGADIPDADPGP